MPTYLYNCKIHNQFEYIHSMNDKLEFCPECEKEGNKTEITRLINFQKGNLIRVDGIEEMKERDAKELKEFKKLYATDENFRANIVGEKEFNDKTIAYEKSLRSLSRKEREIERNRRR